MRLLSISVNLFPAFIAALQAAVYRALSNISPALLLLPSAILPARKVNTSFTAEFSIQLGFERTRYVSSPNYSNSKPIAEKYSEFEATASNSFGTSVTETGSSRY